MMAVWLIVFREMLEAGLVVGIVLSATRGVVGRHLWVNGGIIVGLLMACVLAFFANQITNLFDGIGQEIVNASILSFAILMLAWHNIWMSRHGKELAGQMKELGQAVKLGQSSLMALAIVVGTAIMREGAEVVLFLYGIALSESSSLSDMIWGSALGIISGAFVSMVTYFGLMRIPNKYLFEATGWLITLLAAGMGAQVVYILSQAGLLEWGQNVIWDSSWLLSQGSELGQVLHVLIGYNDTPNLLQLIVYAGIVLAITAMTKSVAKKA